MNQQRSDAPFPEREADDAQWVRAAVEKYEAQLTAYAARLLGDVDRARDVVQDAFLKLWTADRASVNGHLGQWLYRVCRNRALDICRKEVRMTGLHDTQLEGRPHDGEQIATEDRAASHSSLLRMLEALPERQQEVIRLKFQGGLSYREIANVMDLTVNHVGVLLHLGLKAIREKLTASAPSGAAGASRYMR